MSSFFFSKNFFFLICKYSVYGAPIYNPEVKSHMLHWLHQPGTPLSNHFKIVKRRTHSWVGCGLNCKMVESIDTLSFVSGWQIFVPTEEVSVSFHLCFVKENLHPSREELQEELFCLTAFFGVIVHIPNNSRIYSLRNSKFFLLIVILCNCLPWGIRFCWDCTKKIGAPGWYSQLSIRLLV